MIHADLKNCTTSLSAEFQQMLGLSANAAKSMRPGEVPDWVHPEDRDACRKFFQELLKLPEGGSRSLDHRVVLPDGEVRWVRLQAKPLFSGRDEKRRPTEMIGTLLDITAQTQFEQSLKAARKQAERANAAKSEFVANMSHEIRTPMAAMLGYTDLLFGLESDTEKIKHLHTIKRNGQFLLEIINDILDLSKIEAGKLEIEHERFAPDRVVNDVESMMSVRAKEKNLELKVQYDGKIPAIIRSDGKRLKQILVNLIGNAVKFTEAGSVRLVVRYQPGGEKAATPPTLQFEVIDTGIGMTKEQQQRLFQPFSQGDATVTRRFGGTGLGLAISQRLAKMLGGEISVTSHPGQGSTFTFDVHLPESEKTKLVSPRTVTVSEVSTATTTADQQLDCHVLIVDDRRDLRYLGNRILSKAGAKVTEAEDGEAALKIVEESLKADGETGFDLVLLDMQMPRLDGYQTAERLRAMGFEPPIIALTADAMQGDMSRCLESGCDAYLSKPIDAAELTTKVAHYVNDVNLAELRQNRHSAGGTGTSETTPNTASGSNADADRKPPKVMIVDDAVDVCVVTQQLLQLEGFKTQTAHDGPSALKLAKTFQPGIVFLDLSLPGIDGFELLDQLRQQPRMQDVRFVALTGHRDSELERRAREGGFEEYLVKPVDIDRLVHVIRNDANNASAGNG